MLPLKFWIITRNIFININLFPIHIEGSEYCMLVGFGTQIIIVQFDQPKVGLSKKKSWKFDLISIIR
jgi:hypothetical protein